MRLDVLLVEDSPGDVRLTQEAFRDAYSSTHLADKSFQLHVASDGIEAMCFLRREGAWKEAPRPDLILLDLNLPRQDGRETLALIKQDPALRMIPAVILTTSDAEADIVRSYELQASCYLLSGVILLDLLLPDVTGLDAVRRVHAVAPHVSLVVLTGLDDLSLALQSLQEGAQDYFVKGQVETRSLLRGLSCAIERKNLEEELFNQKELAEVTINSIDAAVVSTDCAGNITFLNSVAETMSGWMMDDALGLPLDKVLPVLVATTREITPFPVAEAIGKNRTMPLPPNCVLVRRDGGEIPIEDSVSPIHDRQGLTTGAVIVFRDVSAARAMAKQMAHSAEHDFLTGLPNRLLLTDRLNQAITMATRRKTRVAVLFLDLDGFKHINDSLGHPVGDKLIQSVAKRLVECVRTSDTVSRQGGDEFVVLLSEAEDWEDAATTARRILDAVAVAHPIDHHELHITTSIGVSVFPDDGPDGETLIKNADTAMYHAKESGRQNCQFFKPEMNVQAVEWQEIEEGLRQAVARNEFVLHYQPKVNVLTGGITGAEALLRWNRPDRGLVHPQQFIHIAEASGLIVPIGRWVLGEACRQAREWVDQGLPAATMAVNVSVVELQQEPFLEGLSRILDETGIEPGSLELELTESIFMKNSEAVAGTLRAVRRMGIQVVIDDFGTGYSSLSYLQQFPVDVLKIDQSFVSRIPTATDDSAIVVAVIGLARNLHMRVVAEGVETVEQLAFLQAHHCDEVQGYFFGKPMPADQFARMLERGLLEAVAAHDLDRRIEALERELASRDQIVATLQQELTANRATMEELERGSGPRRTESTRAQDQSGQRRRERTAQSSSPG